MSHNRTHNLTRIALATAVAAVTLVALPGTAQASNASSVVATAAAAKTAPGQPKFGESGPHVVAVQQAIMRNGFTLRGGATGVFDRRTRTALRTFQRVVGLRVTGVVDAATARVLKVDMAPTTTAAPSTTAAPTTTAAPATTVAPAPAPSFPFTAQNLPVRGNRGDAVRTVQQALQNAGQVVRGGIDGMFGSGTTATIQSFQTARGLPVTGVLDTATAVALGLIAAPAPAPAPVAAPVAATTPNAGTFLTRLPVRGNRGDSVRTVQQALVAAGIEVKGGVDGVFGGATAVAIQNFQTAKGIPVTGRLDTRTGIALGVVAPPQVQIAVFPVQGPCSFENTWHAPRGGGRLHKGVDIIAREGNLIYAVADGVITKTYSTATDRLAGNGVRLTQADGTYFFYGHFQSIAPGITVGTRVKAGQVIGFNGKTGATNTPHLHFEVHPFGGEAIDPTSIVAAVDACHVTTPLPVP